MSRRSRVVVDGGGMARNLAGASLRALEFRDTTGESRAGVRERDFADSPKPQPHFSSPNALTVGATITVAARSDTACLVCRHDHRGGHRPHCHELAEVQADCRAMRASPTRTPGRPAREPRVGNEHRSRRAVRVLPACCVLRGRGHAPGTPPRACSTPHASVPPVFTRRISPRAREPPPACPHPYDETTDPLFPSRARLVRPSLPSPPT